MTTQRADPHARRDPVTRSHRARDTAQAQRLAAALVDGTRDAAQARLLQEALKR